MPSVNQPPERSGEDQTEPVTISLDDWEPLPDVSGRNLSQLVKGTPEDSPLRRALDRLVKSLDDPEGVISAFSSFAEA